MPKKVFPKSAKKKPKAAPTPKRPTTPARKPKPTTGKGAKGNGKGKPRKAPSVASTGRTGAGVGETSPKGRQSSMHNVGPVKKQTAKKPLRKRKPTKRRKPKPDPPEPAAVVRPKKPGIRSWYVLSVEPGMDSRARKAIRKQKKIDGLEKYIGRVYSPVHIEEVTIPAVGDEVCAGGPCDDARTARREGNRHAWWSLNSSSFSGMNFDLCPEGYRVQVFPTKRGDWSASWQWRVIKLIPGSEKTVSRKVLKFPGYLIAHLKLTPDAFHLVTSAKGVLNILMSNDRPTPLESEEAALLLVEQAAANLAARKKEKKKVELLYRVGDMVAVVDGTWKNQVGKVIQISGEDHDPEVTVEVTVLGNKLPVKIQHWLLVKKESK